MLCKQIFAPSNPLVLGCSANTPHLNLSWGLWDAAIIMPLSLSCLCTKSFHLAECFIYEMREPYTVGGRFTASVYVKEGGGGAIFGEKRKGIFMRKPEWNKSLGWPPHSPTGSIWTNHPHDGGKCIQMCLRVRKDKFTDDQCKTQFAHIRPNIPVPRVITSNQLCNAVWISLNSSAKPKRGRPYMPLSCYESSRAFIGKQERDKTDFQNEHRNIVTRHQNTHEWKRAECACVCVCVCMCVCVCVSVSVFSLHRNQRVSEAVELRLHRGLRFF